MSGPLPAEPGLAGYRLVSPDALSARLDGAPPPLVLDVRRSAAFREHAEGIPGAVALLLDEDPVRIPDVARDRPLVVYCLCQGEASSSRVARWLVAAGYRDVSVLEGGLGAWKQRGSPLAPVSIDSSRAGLAWMSAVGPAGGDDLFHSRLEAESVSRGAGALRRRMSVLFVDMADSTRLLASHSNEEVLALVQTFMEVVAEVGALHCGDVHDFEGDGALLYFEGTGEAVPAAFELRRRLLERRRTRRELPLPRISLDEGPLVIGTVGGRFRRGVALVGPAVPRAARILKLAPPGAIIATERVVVLARETSPDLAQAFVRLPDPPPLRGFPADDTPALYVAANGNQDPDIHD